MAEAVDAVVFDLGGVILEVDFNRVFDAWAGAAGVPAAQILERFRLDAAYERHERGEIDANQYFAALRETLGLSLSDAQFAAGWNCMVGAAVAGAPEVLVAAERRWPLYVFSNTNAMHYAHWGPGHAGLMQHFKRLFLSFEMGLRKPEALAFAQITREIGVPMGRILFFDDTAENVDAALALGMQAVLVRGTGDVRAALAGL